jgi:hypothetical protein
VIVTADHSHTSQMTYTTGVPATGTSFATLNTVDNTPIRVSYGTADTGSGATTSGSQHHTGAEVPVYAAGPRAADIQGTIDQTDIFSVLTNVRAPAGAADTTQVGPVGGTVPATLAFTLGQGAAFPAFTPGVAKDYTATTAATVTSTAGDAALSVADPSSSNPGKLVNGAYTLAQPVQARAGNGAFAPVSATPAILLTYTGPVSNDAVPIELKQSIGANEGLRTGSYAKTFTFTLSTTAP